MSNFLYIGFLPQGRIQFGIFTAGVAALQKHDLWTGTVNSIINFQGLLFLIWLIWHEKNPSNPDEESVL